MGKLPFFRCGLRVAARAVVLVGIAILALSGADVAFAALACGQTVTADTTLDRDLEGCAEDGLIIGAAGVTLDLNGHWITGSAVGSTGSGVLIAADDATVRNGRVAGFSVGVAADAQQGFGFDFRLDSLELVRNGIGVSAFDPGGLTGHFATIESSEISRNADRGISASFYNVTVTDSMIRRNGGDGIHTLESPGRYEGNDISNNGGTGLVLDDHVATMVGNRIHGNGRSGVVLRIGSFPDPLSLSFAKDNELTNNGELGFYALSVGPWEGFDGGGNIAKGNGDARQCLVETASFPGAPQIPPEALVCAHNRRSR